MSISESVLKWLHIEHEPKWDFVVFRCTFDDDEAWTQCLECLQACTSATLKQGEHCENAIVMLNWVIREERELDGAGADMIRRLHSPDALP